MKAIVIFTVVVLNIVTVSAHFIFSSLNGKDAARRPTFDEKLISVLKRIIEFRAEDESTPKKELKSGDIDEDKTKTFVKSADIENLILAIKKKT